MTARRVTPEERPIQGVRGCGDGGRVFAFSDAVTLWPEFPMVHHSSHAARRLDRPMVGGSPEVYSGDMGDRLFRRHHRAMPGAAFSGTLDGSAAIRRAPCVNSTVSADFRATPTPTRTWIYLDPFLAAPAAAFS